jgi:hypothetical protein
MGESQVESANVSEDEDGVWIAFVDNSGDDELVDNEGEYGKRSGSLGEETDEDLWFTDIPSSLASPVDSINPLDYFDDFGNLPDDSGVMPDLVDVTDSSDDEQDDIPPLKTINISSDNKDNLYAEYWGPEMTKDSLNNEGGYESMPELVEVSDSSDDKDSDAGSETSDDLGPLEDKVAGLTWDTGDDAYTRTFTCALLTNTAGTNEGVETELYDSGALRHMTTY